MLKTTLTAVALCLGLVACQNTTNGTQPSTGQQAAAGLQLVAGACKAAKPVMSAVPQALPNASAPTQATVNNIETYYNAACATEAAIAAVVAKDPTGGNDTATWIGGLSAGVLTALPTVGQLIH